MYKLQLYSEKEFEIKMQKSIKKSIDLSKVISMYEQKCMVQLFIRNTDFNCSKSIQAAKISQRSFKRGAINQNNSFEMFYLQCTQRQTKIIPC